MNASTLTRPAVSLNNEQRLFVLKSDAGYSCLGFDVVEGHIKELVARLGDASSQVPAAPPEVGTLERYDYYRALLSAYGRTKDNRTWFSPNTPEKLSSLLERLRESDEPVRLFTGNPETGLDSLECWDTIGVIGRTTGLMKSPILVPKGECGGCIISTDRVLKVVSMKTGRVLYKHDKYQLPSLEIGSSTEPKYPHAVSADGVVVANFKTYAKACNWVAFVSGEHNQEPR